MDQLARKGAFFKNAFSPAPWTKPSVASIFTGYYPSQHKVTSVNSKMNPPYQVMSQYFKAKDYAAGGIVSHTLISPKTGYSRGFDFYKMVKFSGNVHDSVTSDQVTDMAIKWLDGNAGKRFFLFLHYFDPHFAYQHHAEFDRTSSYKGKIPPGLAFRQLRDMIPEMSGADKKYIEGLYDEETAFTDKHMGRLLKHLEAKGLDKQTLLVLTADHGEEFFEHDWLGHTRTLYNELIHVPLIFYWPGKVAARTIAENVSTVDILPTFLELLHGDGSEHLKPLPGLSLLPSLIGASKPPSDRALFSEVDFKSAGIQAFKLAVVKENFKLVYDKDTLGYELYDLVKDPDEKRDLAGSDQAALSRLKPLLEEYQAALGGKDTARDQALADQSEGKTPKEVEQLKSLGYL